MVDSEFIDAFSPDSNTGLGLGDFPLRYLADRKQTAFRAMASGPFELLGRQHRLSTGVLYSKQDVSSDSFYATNSIELDHTSVNTSYAGLVFDVYDSISIYTSYTEIFQAQNAKDVNGQRLEPVEGSNIEAGIKGDFLNEELTASFAVYKVEEDNVAARDPINEDVRAGLNANWHR